VAHLAGLLGITPSGGKQSVVLFGIDFSEFLEAVIHEGIHRVRGKQWALQSKIGQMRYHPKSQVLLRPVSRKLDEGTVQIFTLQTISSMAQKGWFKGYTSASYADEVKYVKGILAAHGKGKAFLEKAYFSDSSKYEVADLRSWQ